MADMRGQAERCLGDRDGEIVGEIDVVARLEFAARTLIERQRLLLRGIVDRGLGGHRPKRRRNVEIRLDKVGAALVARELGLGIEIVQDPAIQLDAADRVAVARDQIDFLMAGAGDRYIIVDRGTPYGRIEARFVGDRDRSLNRRIVIGLRNTAEPIIGHDGCRRIDRDRRRWGGFLRERRGGGSGEQERAERGCGEAHRFPFENATVPACFYRCVRLSGAGNAPRAANR